MIKCLNTARKKHNESHTKVVLLKSKTDQLIEINKVSYKESMAAERSTGKISNNLGLSENQFCLV